MGVETRVGLLLGATACLLAVMVDWVVEELTSDQPVTGGHVREAAHEGAEGPAGSPSTAVGAAETA